MSAKPDMRIISCRLFFIDVQTRVPLRFGAESVNAVTCARVEVEVEDSRGRRVRGWGETPLNTSWVWPCELSHAERDAALRCFCHRLSEEVAVFPEWGHAMELGHLFMTQELHGMWESFNRERGAASSLPWLAVLACFSPFDIALHDAYASGVGRFVYDIYTAEFMNHDLSWYYGTGEGSGFRRKYPADFLEPMSMYLPAWHLVGGEDPLSIADLHGGEPDDGYPVLLGDWIRRDGLFCLKVKLSGVDGQRDLNRLVEVGTIGAAAGVKWLCADFNCMVDEASYVTDILDALASDYAQVFAMILYLEQPFHRDLHRHMRSVECVSSRKPLFMDESAHDWRHVRLGRELGWTGVALKTCKTQTGALLSFCWARAHGMPVMVQDLTNPMLAQIPHVLLAAHTGTLMGVETNAMQFYPDASLPEAAVHPGLYVRRNGMIRLDTLKGNGFGYTLDSIHRILPQQE